MGTFTGSVGNDLICGSDGADAIDAGAGADTVFGYDGNDVVKAGPGGDFVEGGAGTDTLVFTGNFAEYFVAYNSKTGQYFIADSVWGRDGVEYVIDDVERFQFADGVRTSADLRQQVGIDFNGLSAGDYAGGTPLNDYLYGGKGIDTFSGLGGNDWFVGVGGDDRLDGGDGVDMAVYSGPAADYVITSDGAFGFFVTDSVPLRDGVDHLTGIERLVFTDGISLLGVATPGNDTVVGTGASDTLAGLEGSDVLFGLAGADDLSGGAGNDTIDGGSGADTMSGDAGDDTFIVDDRGDTVRDSAGIDTVSSAIDYTLGPDIENLQLTGGAVTGNGNGAANVLTGNAANNLMHGYVGSDVLYGLDGNDQLFGESMADTLYGGTGNDTLDGGDGIDLMDGGSGDDVFFVSNASDVVRDNDGGTDRVIVSIGSYVLPAGIENLGMAAGTVAQNATGNSANNSLAGNDGANALVGAGGSDSLWGYGGSDTLRGGAGNDSLWGGAGNDMFVFGAGDFAARERDEIFDFDKGDRLDFRGMGRPANLTIRMTGSFLYTVTGDYNGDGVMDFTLVVHTGTAGLTASDFIWS